MLKRITNTEYQSIPAISHSLLVQIRKEGILPAFLNSSFNPNREDETKDCFDIGNAYHALCSCPEVVENFPEYEETWKELQSRPKEKGKEIYLTIELPETTWYIYDFGQKRTNKAYVEFCSNVMLTGDDLVLNWEEFSQVCEMAKQMRENLIFRYLTEKNEIIGYENSYLSTLSMFGSTIDFRIRPDLLVKSEDGSYIIVDFKSSRYVSYDDMERIGYFEGYDIQAKLYIDRIAEEYNVPKDKVRFICLIQSKKYPSIIRAFEFTNDSLVEADTDIETLSCEFWEKYLQYKEDGDINHFIEPDLEIHKFKHYERKITEDLKGDM